MSTETLTAALRATNLEPPLASLADRLARVEARMAEAHAAGAGLVVMPEFACARWLSFAPHGLPSNRQVPWLAEMAAEALPALRALPAGTPMGHPAVDTVVGAAAAYLPCDVSLNNVTGIAAALDPVPAASGASPVLYAHHLPVMACRRIRHGGAEAEVWPGSWGADHLRIADPAPPQP